MNQQEAAALLSVAAAFDNRKPDPDAATAWSYALEGIRFPDARDAIVAHYRRSSEWLMPEKVIAEVKRIRRDRLTAFGELPPPPADLSPRETLEWQRDLTRRIADGEITERPPTPEAIEAPEAARHLRELRRKAEHDEREGLAE